MKKKNNNQLNLFEFERPAADTRQIKELDGKILESLSGKRLAEAKDAAKRQEKLLKKILEDKKKGR